MEKPVFLFFKKEIHGYTRPFSCKYIIFFENIALPLPTILPLFLF